MLCVRLGKEIKGVGKLRPRVQVEEYQKKRKYCLSLRARVDVQLNNHETENANTQGGKHVAARRVGSDFTDFHLYTVAKDENILVTVRNLSRTRDISFWTVYVDENFQKREVETDVELKSGLEVGFETITDDQGKTVLKLNVFVHFLHSSNVPR